MKTTPIERAAIIVGGVSALARLLNIKPPTVFQWKSQERRIPAARCPEIERLTKRAVLCEELRPDVDWGYVRGTPRFKRAA